MSESEAVKKPVMSTLTVVLDDIKMKSTAIKKRSNDPEFVIKMLQAINTLTEECIGYIKHKYPNLANKVLE